MSLYTRVRKMSHLIDTLSNFEIFRQCKKKYNEWFWKEKKVTKCFSPKQKDVAYIIRRYAKNMGIGSYIISNLSQINYCLEKKYIPVIDMLNYNGTHIEGKGVCDSWELYFEQPVISLEEAYKSQMFWLSDGSPKENTPSDSMEFLANSDKLEYWHKIFVNNIKFNQLLKNYLENEVEEIIANRGKILGVLCRGTDYLELRPQGHPIQPQIDEVIEKAKIVMEKYECEYLYLATEDYAIEEKFRNEFGNRVLTNKRVYKKYESGFLANVSNSRKDDFFHTNVEYLSSLYLLSKCDCFIGGRTSGTIVALLMNYKYEYTFFWDKGEY